MNNAPRQPSKEELEMIKDRIEFRDNKFYSLRQFIEFKLCLTGKGYPTINLTVNKKSVGYKAHHLSWFFNKGSWPKKQLDHIDTNKNNWFIDNLREANNGAQRINRQGRSKHGLGVRRINGRYTSNIRVSNVIHYLGCYATKEEAALAYKVAYNKFYGEELNV